MEQLARKEDPNQLTHGSDLLLKYDIHFADFNRAALIGFDLSSIDRDRLIGARLKLAIAPNELANKKTGFHRYEPNRIWKFHVGGIWDSKLEPWTEETVTWNNAPGIAPETSSGRETGSGGPKELGEFLVVGHGQRGDWVVIDGKQLVDFLKADNDGRISLVIHRITGDLRRGYFDHTVHGFASREDRSLSPPTLELWMD